MSSMTKLRGVDEGVVLTTTEAAPRDVGRGIVRLDPEHLTAMGQVLVDRGEYVAVVRALQDRRAELLLDRRRVSDGLSG